LPTHCSSSSDVGAEEDQGATLAHAEQVRAA